MRTKAFLLIVICLINFGLKAQNTGFPFPKIKLSQLPELVEGNWVYDYSFNSDSTFIKSGEYLQEHYVPYRIEFTKTRTKENKRLSQKHPWLVDYRKASCLNEYSFWVDMKGMIR